MKKILNILALAGTLFSAALTFAQIPALLSSQNTPTIRAAANQSQIVYVTRTGKRYHRASCRYAQNGIATTIAEAIAHGFTPCHICRPPVN